MKVIYPDAGQPQIADKSIHVKVNQDLGCVESQRHKIFGEIRDIVDFSQTPKNADAYYSYHSPVIKDGSELQEILDKRIFMITQLKQLGDTATSQKLADSVSILSQRMLQGGIITDPLSGEKYFISIGSLKGGGANPSKAQDVRLFERDKLCQTGEGAMKMVRRELNHLAENRDCCRQALVTIKNSSRYLLQYKAHGTSSGYLFF